MKVALIVGGILLLVVIALVALPRTVRAGALQPNLGPPPPAPPNSSKRIASPSLEQQFLQSQHVPGAQYTDKFNNTTDKLTNKLPGGSVVHTVASAIVNPIHTQEKLVKKVWSWL